MSRPNDFAAESVKRDRHLSAYELSERSIMNVLTPRRVASVLPLVAVLGMVDARAATAQESIGALMQRFTFPMVEKDALAIHPPTARPTQLVTLYVSFATLQALDIASTRKALGSGGVEANPVVAPLAGSPVALTVAKVGAAGAMIYASERLWKPHRKAALLTMIGLNVAYATAVAHNYRVARARVSP